MQSKKGRHQNLFQSVSENITSYNQKLEVGHGRIASCRFGVWYLTKEGAKLRPLHSPSAP